MLIICPTCVSTYRLSPATQAAHPTTARCAQCRSVFAIDPVATAARQPAALVPARDRAGPSLARSSFAPEPVALTQGIRSVHPLRRATGPAPRPAASAAPRLVVVGIMLGLTMAGLAFRDRVAEAAPGLAPLLLVATASEPVLQDVKTVLEQEGTGKVLTLQGRIANTGRRDAPVPDLRIVVRDDDAQGLYTWTTPSPQATLAPGETVAFRSRLVAPPGEGHDVVVSFAETYGDVGAIRPRSQP